MIRIENIEKDFNEDTKIHLKDLKFENGKTYAILGVSGSGKTTLLNMIAGIVTPTCGKIFVDNIEVTSLTQKEKDEYEYQRAVEAQERIKRMMFSAMESDGGSDG